jgi:Flp pilus assembly protein TadD
MALRSERSAEELRNDAGSIGREGQEKYALKLLRRAQEKAPKNLDVLYALADAYMNHQFFLNYRKALTCIQEAEGLDRDLSRVRTYYGKYFLNHGNLEKAEEYFEKAAETPPVFAPALDYLDFLHKPAP